MRGLWVLRLHGEEGRTLLCILVSIALNPRLSPALQLPALHRVGGRAAIPDCRPDLLPLPQQYNACAGRQHEPGYTTQRARSRRTLAGTTGKTMVI